MAQLKDLLVNGVSRLVGDVFLDKINAPTTSTGSNFGLGTSGQVLKTNGNNIYWGTDEVNAGTVTSVQVAATSPVVSSVGTASSSTLSTTISLANGYGDTKNPYASKTKNYVLAAPNGSNGVPSFRALVAADLPTVSNVAILNTTSNTNYYLTGVARINNAFETNLYGAFNSSGTYNTTGVYFNGAEGVLFGAAWNDYAEFRQSDEEIEFGRVVQEIGNGKLKLVNQRLAKGCEIVSDTYGFAIGKSETCKLPIATTGRVLAYPDKDPLTFKIGACVCSGLNGTVSQMTEEEERLYPGCILGTVSEIPTYEIWHGGKDIVVNGRIWIRIR